MSFKAIDLRRSINRFSSLFLITFFMFISFPMLYANETIVEDQFAAPALISIEHINRGTNIGEIAHVQINFSPGIDPFEMTAFELLFSYDADKLTINSITPGSLLESCQWESFSATQDTLALCDLEPCPIGMIRIVAFANALGASGSSLCNITTAGTLLNIDFQVKNDSSLTCTVTDIDFYWVNCGSNTASSKRGDTLFISNKVFSGDRLISKDTTLPTIYGSPNACITNNSTNRRIDFFGGNVDFRCIDNRDYRGDINLNEIPNEIADAVLFSNYFFFGLDIFTNDQEQQIIASDVNADGLTLTLDDYVYLWRIVVGEVNPFPKPPNVTAFDTVLFTQNKINKTVSFSYSDSLSAVHLIFEGDLRPWGWGDDDTLGSGPFPFNGTHTRVLLDRFLHGPTVFSQDSLFNYTGEGTLVGAFAAYDGINSIPTAINGGSGSCCLHRGNVDGDSLGLTDISDLVTLVSYLFETGTAPPCFEEGDISADWNIDIADLVFIVNFIFLQGPPPTACQ